MKPIRIRLRDNGPLVVQGPVEVVDATGSAFQLDGEKEMVALCRCGHSSKRPFCDGSHRETGFRATERAEQGK